ncbi:beta-ketoacyl-ACP synthase [Mesoterricola silvestris]|uniref:beta-ketoacyl-ACP synthase n=1 Tax=Mesoterricola silvestris TaxID=2927979 RepID=UPI00292FC21B|nr:beta-ketoacyl-ACP synthase [Mesoterricola silvestris]
MARHLAGPWRKRLERRVVITGMGAITALGSEWAAVEGRLREGRSAVVAMPAWDAYPSLQTRLGAPIPDFAAPAHYPRKLSRSMGRVAMLGVRASELAMEDAGLRGDPFVQSGRMGVAYGSSSGSLDPILSLGSALTGEGSANISATGYIQFMSHTAAVNIGLFFGLTGRVIPTSSACTSGSQGLGYAYESIKYGMQDAMVAGGSDELTFCSAAVFDTLFATSLRNGEPHLTPRPFDRNRDGLVLGEGACTLVLEERERALARGARIHAEILGFGTNSDGAHITQPQMPTMAATMATALGDAGLSPDAVDWVNAHGTATEHGDIAESQATWETFRRAVPITSFKSYLGHTLGACGAIETWLGIHMTRSGRVAPTLNLEEVDPRCGPLDYIQGGGRAPRGPLFMNNNFAFGGINTSLLIRCEP